MQGGEDILARIVETKASEVEALAGQAESLRARAAAAPEPRDFRGAVTGFDAVSLIAEVKRRSPGAGAIDLRLDPVHQAGLYLDGGARALSVLTDRVYFEGSLQDLRAVREAVGLPVLRKDFTIDELQIWEARSAGADAILLIVRILDDTRLRSFRELAEELGMAAVVEAHDAYEVERALRSGADVLGLNNRDLRTFETRIETTLELLDLVPEDVVVVSESGIFERGQVQRLGERGVEAILVGEALVAAGDPVELARSLSDVPITRRREPTS